MEMNGLTWTYSSLVDNTSSKSLVALVYSLLRRYDLALDCFAVAALMIWAVLVSVLSKNMFD